MTAAVKTRSWLSVLLSRAAVLGLLFWWKTSGFEPAENLFLFLIWVGAICGFLAMLVPPVKNILPCTALQATVINLFRLVTVFSIVWFGHFGLAALYLVGVAGSMIYASKFDACGSLVSDPKASKP